MPGAVGGGEDPLVREEGPAAVAPLLVLVLLVEGDQEGELSLGGQGSARLLRGGGVYGGASGLSQPDKKNKDGEIQVLKGKKYNKVQRVIQQYK